MQLAASSAKNEREHTARDPFTLSGLTGRRWRRGQPETSPKTVKRRLGQFALRLAVVAIIIPGLLSAVGAIIDRTIFGADANPHFHVRGLAFSGLVASPAMLLRWCYSKGKYLTAVKFTVYALQTVGVFVAYNEALVAGVEAYHVVEHVRTFFSVDGQFDDIKSEDDVYDWLEKVMERVYNNSETTSERLGRVVGGRLSLVLAPRLRQNRVRRTACAGNVPAQGLHGFEMCYRKFSAANEDRSPHTSKNFTWTNLPYETYTSQRSMSDVFVRTKLNTYPVAGYWTYFPINVPYELAVNQLRAMRQLGWIDMGTRLIALDFTIEAPDMEIPIWGVVEFNIEISQSGQFLPNTPMLVFNHLPRYEDALEINVSGRTEVIYKYLSTDISRSRRACEPWICRPRHVCVKMWYLHRRGVLQSVLSRSLFGRHLHAV